MSHFLQHDFLSDQINSWLIQQYTDDYNCYYEDPILLPQSTHSLLYTEQICSAPFNYSLLIICLSLPSLVLALVNNLSNRTPGNPLGLPVQVDTSVRITQYVGEWRVMLWLISWFILNLCWFRLFCLFLHLAKHIKTSNCNRWELTSVGPQAHNDADPPYRTACRLDNGRGDTK